MSEDFVTRLRLQLREAALREERRRPVARRMVQARRGLPGPAPVAVAVVVALLALAVGLGALALRGEPEPAQPRIIGTYPVASGLSQLAPGFGAVWTADPIRGEILRIDPASRRVAARIPVRGEARVATGAGAVWAIAGEQLFSGVRGSVQLLRIDPTTNRVVARIPMRTPAGDDFRPIELQIDRGVVWVVGTAGAMRIDPSRNGADLFVDLTDETGGETRGAVTEGDNVWVLTVDGRLRQFDAITNRAVAAVRIRAQADSYLSWGPAGTLTLIGTDEIALLERANGRRLWDTRLSGEIRYWTADDDVLWVAHVSRAPGARDRLSRLDVESGRRRGYVDLPEPGVAGIAKVGRDIWVASPAGKIVVVR
jgi:hypothetical protein